MAIKLLHFADAHIDMANYGKRNPETGLPFRVEDFLTSLDFIVDTAIEREVDLVIFAGDAYKDRSPAPTFQREWGKRIMRLSNAEIPTILVVGNHDSSPALGRAHTMQEFETLETPYVLVIDKPMGLGPDDLSGVPVKVIGLPWFTNSSIKTFLLNRSGNTDDMQENFAEALQAMIDGEIDSVEEDLPIIFTAHASVKGATFGRERNVMLGQDFVIPQSLVRNPRFDYCALGHIHKPQNLNDGNHPPVIYPGSIEKVDFGEAGDTKYCILATIERGKTECEWIELPGRKFIDRFARIEKDELNLTQKLIAKLPSQKEMKDAIVRLVVEFPEGVETQINEGELTAAVGEDVFEFRLVKRPKLAPRVRLSPDQQMAAMTPLELLDIYWKTKDRTPEEREQLLALAKTVLSPEEQEESA